MGRHKEEDLRQVMKQSDDLLDQLDAIGKEGSQPSPKDTANNRQGQDPIPTHYSDRSQGGSSNTLVVLAWLFAGIFIIIIGVALQNQSTPRNTGSTSTSPPSGGSEEVDKPHKPDFKPDPIKDESSLQQVSFSGIYLPITNRLCNKKETFCIYGLAKLVQDEVGTATYDFVDTTNGERVTIYGEINISNLQRAADGGRTFTFAFKDNQSRTTQGWAAAGYFYLDQDAKQPGILTRFKTTESFGPKTPVGLENTSYLFPR